MNPGRVSIGLASCVLAAILLLPAHRVREPYQPAVGPRPGTPIRALEGSLAAGTPAGGAIVVPNCLIRQLSRRSPSRQALWAARWLRTLAQQAVNEQRDAFEQGSLRATAATEASPAIILLAQDRSGCLHQACVWARRAAHLARTPAEEYDAAQWLALIDCELARHRDELEQARRLVALDPGNPLSWVVVRRAAGCNGLVGPQTRAADALLLRNDPAECALRYPRAVRSRPPADGAARPLDRQTHVCQFEGRTDNTEPRTPGTLPPP